MKSFGMMLIVIVAFATSASVAFAQHGHGMGHMGMHGDVDDAHAMHTAGHIPAHPVNVPNALSHNPALEARLQRLLPAGTNLQTAASGFKTLGQFVAAVHVSHNLNIPFAQLKTKMTGSSPESLGRAIEDLEPNLSHRTVRSDVKTADRQARQDLEEAREQLDKDDQTSTTAQAR